MDQLTGKEKRILVLCVMGVMASLALMHLNWGERSAATVTRREPIVRHIATPRPEAQSAYVLHIWKIADLYSGFPKKLERRAQPELLNISHVVKWDAAAAAKNFAVQLSAQADFSGSRLQLQASQGFLNVQKAFAGDNFWRVSAQKPRWSGTGHFFVRPVFLDEVVKAKVLQSNRGEVRVQWAADAVIHGLILEISPRPEFPQGLTAVTHMAFESENSKVTHHKFLQAGTYYLRSRGYNRWQQVSEYSPTVAVKVN